MQLDYVEIYELHIIFPFFCSCTHSSHVYPRFFFRWAVGLGQHYTLVPQLSGARTSPVHAPTTGFLSMSYSLHCCFLGLLQALQTLYFHSANGGYTVHHVNSRVSEDGQKLDLFSKTPDRAKPWDTTGFLFSPLAARVAGAQNIHGGRTTLRLGSVDGAVPNTVSSQAQHHKSATNVFRPSSSAFQKAPPFGLSWHLNLNWPFSSRNSVQKKKKNTTDCNTGNNIQLSFPCHTSRG